MEYPILNLKILNKWLKSFTLELFAGGNLLLMNFIVKQYKGMLGAIVTSKYPYRERLESLKTKAILSESVNLVEQTLPFG